MKKLLILILAAFMSVTVAMCAACSQEQFEKGEGANVNSLAQRNLKRGTYMSLKMYKDFYDEEDELAHRNIPELEGENDWSDCWRYTGLFSMMLRCNELNNKKYTSQFNHLITGFDYYKGKRSGYRQGFELAEDDTIYTVFAVDRGSAPNKAGAAGRASVFDDQIWIAREYLNAYKLYGNKEYLDTAEELSNYIYKSGWTPQVGGITWGQNYDTRHSCSNAPFVKVLIELADAVEATSSANAKTYRDWATNVYEWTYKTLRDTSDNLYYDLIGTEKDAAGNYRNSSMDETKYTYNSGAMISAGVAMYNMTHEQRYLDEAKATAQSCYDIFGNHAFLEGYTMYPTGTTNWFNLVMYIGYYDLFLADNTQTVYLDDLQRTIDYAYENFGHDGYIPIAWLVGWENGWEKSDCKNLLDHSSHAETYLLLSQYQEKKAEIAAKA